MSASATALLGIVGSQASTNTPLGRWAQQMSAYLDGGANQGNMVNLLHAAGGQLSLSTPIGQFALAISKNADGGLNPSRSLGFLSAARGQVGAGPLLSWLRRAAAGT